MSILLQHYFNPLHIFCRLREVGLPKTYAIFISQIYERAIFIPLLANRDILKRVAINIRSEEKMSNGSWLK